jgi:hypothetical protein
MSYFVNLAKANADNSRLSAELTALVGERDKLTAAIAERDAAAESCRAQFDATLADLTEKLSVANAQIATLNDAAQTAGQQAAEVIAAQGVDPAKLPKPAAPAAAATMKRADFNALSVFDRMQFAKSGGRLTE